MSTHINVTGSQQSYIPYTMLERGAVCLMFGRVPLNITLSSLQTCLVSVPPAFRIRDSDRYFDRTLDRTFDRTDQPDNITLSVLVGLGTSFVVRVIPRQ